MGLLDRTPAARPQPISRHAAARADGLSGAKLLEAADAAYGSAEQRFDRSPETREELEDAYLAAAEALDTEGHPQRAHAWLGLATIRRYQKGRRDDTLAAFDLALDAAPDSIEVWDSYLDYITYAVSAAALTAIVERMPAAIRLQKLDDVVAVGRGVDRWGTMSAEEQKRFTDALPELLAALDDQPSLGALLSTTALYEYRNGSHVEAHKLMRSAVDTGYASPACVDRFTIDLVKLGDKTEAAAVLRGALARPVPSDSMRSRMTKRLARCTGGAPRSAHDSDDVREEPPAPATTTRHLRKGENTVVEPRIWRAQIGWHDPSNTVDVDATALLLGADGRVADDRDMVFYNQLASPDGSVRHGGEQTLGHADLFEELQVDLPTVPADVAAIAVCASVHEGTFSAVVGLHVRLEGDGHLVFTVPPLSTERAVVLFEFYRRTGAWKVRAVGQGYDDGLAGLAREFGVSTS